jgi:hypothetical protein
MATIRRSIGGVILACFLAGAITALVAQERGPQQPATGQAQSAPAAEPIDFQRAQRLRQGKARGERLSPEDEAYLQRAMEARRRGQGQAALPAGGRESVGFKPLTEMSAEDRYKEQDGGLYGKGKNAPPTEHAEAANAALGRIQPLDAEGKPSPAGTIGFVSISMSNATQEFSTFKRLADADPAKSAQVTIVDCAQGGQAMAQWVDADARPWQEADRRLAAARLAPQQVQVAWIKLANISPRGALDEHGKRLQRDTQAVIQNAKTRFPNLQVAYLSSRIYGGYATGPLNPEPYAYESGFVVRWLIQAQIAGEPALNHDAQKGPVTAPVLLWGPYLWAGGVVPRNSDGLTYLREDLAADGTHPSLAGREKVARLMLDFYKSDPLARAWFTDGR